MTKILFICHGNICRSPMAEYIFKHLAAQAGRSAEFKVASGAVSREEIGSDIYPPAKQILRAHGVPFERHAAHQVTEAELRRYDVLILMDQRNADRMRRLFGDTFVGKTSLLMTYAGEHRDVADPWYTDDFETAFRDIEAGCRGLLESI